MNNLQYNLEQGLNNSHDLKKLLSGEYHQIVDQLMHHMEQMKVVADNDWTVNQVNYNRINQLIQDEIQKKLKTFLIESKKIQQVDLKTKNESMRLTAWNKIIDTLDVIFKTVELFPFRSKVSFDFADSKLVISGVVSANDLSTNIREKSYQITRFFFLNETLLTYDVRESATEGDAQMTLSFDFSHRQDIAAGVSLNDGDGQENGGYIGFSNSFLNYQIDKDTLFTIGDHLCLEVDDTYQLNCHTSIPAKYRENFLASGEVFSILYFPFLFRPISLIIPKRGQLMSMGIFEGKNKLNYFDFFSFINK